METENNAGTKVIGILTLALAAWGIYKVLQLTDEPKKKLDGLGNWMDYNKLPGKSEAASHVLKLMDKDYDYPDALRMVIREKTKGLSLNQTKRFKAKLERELNRYI